MLTEQAVERLIQDGGIQLSYYFDPLAKPPDHLDQQRVDLTAPNSKATQAFRSALFGDRLGLTLGPLVFSHTHKRARDRVQYKNYRGVYDLQATDGHIVLKPKESITVNAIERVALDGSLGALILPRLSLATVGLTLTPTYIDPLWEGIPPLHLVNVSRYPYNLEFGEKIAVCRFYHLDGEALDESFRQRFAEKSHHYGLSWDRIFTSDADPFPLRKLPAGRAPLGDRVASRVSGGWARLATGGVTGLAIVAAAIAYGRFEDQVGRVHELNARVQRLEASPLANGRIGRATVRIPSGARVGANAIPIAGPSANAAVLVEKLTGSHGTEVRASIVPSPSGTGAVLEITASRIVPASTEEVVVQWVAF